MEASSAVGAGRVLEDASFNLASSKTRPPPSRPGMVARRALMDRLLASPAAPVICVVAPPGYGKTTLLAQWAERIAGRVAWVSLDRRDNDPVVLVRYLATALDQVEPIDPRLFEALAAPNVSVPATVMPRLLSALSAMTGSVALVLDHLELLENQECLDAVAEVALGLPVGSRLALASRRTPALPVAMLRAQGLVMEVGAAELAMDPDEGRALLENAGAGLSDPEVTELLARSEGWPVGLYLAALARQAGGAQHKAEVGFTGDDRFMVDYLQSELLAQLPAEQVTFLTRTALLERMCRPLCDAVLGSTGSGRFLESLERSNLLLIPLDRRREWYRYHQLLRQFLLAELERREPELITELHARAATWYEANGLPDVAVDHAQAAGDADQMARLVATWGQPAYAGGRVDTALGWFGWFEERSLMERYPTVAILGAWIQALVGRPAAAERWAAAAEAGTGAAGADQQPPDGSTLDSHLALLRGVLCRDGIDRMRADVQAALAGLHRASPWRVTALLLVGIADMLDDQAGQPDEADAVLAHVVEDGFHTGGLPAAATALAERCLLAIQRKDWELADILAGQAVATLEDGHLEDYVISPLVHAVAAHTALHRGDVPCARDHLARAARLRPLLTHAIPVLAVQTLLELGRAYLALDDLAGARAVLRQARDVLQQRPDLGVLPGQLQDLRARLDTARGALPGASSLTTAELRLLPLLATHLTFREVGQRLYISQHTVKTQAISIYRKLGVSSRGHAVERVQEIGLLAR